MRTLEEEQVVVITKISNDYRDEESDETQE